VEQSVKNPLVPEVQGFGYEKVEVAVEQREHLGNHDLLIPVFIGGRRFGTFFQVPKYLNHLCLPGEVNLIPSIPVLRLLPQCILDDTLQDLLELGQEVVSVLETVDEAHLGKEAHQRP
jgi:hypothetical protein